MGMQPTGTVTFLLTDVEGSTALWETQGSSMERAMARHDEILRNAFQASDGYVFTTAGDSFAVAFADALDAVTAALEAQRVIHEEPWEVGSLKVRMGIHTGVAQERDGDYFGPAVNRAARIMDAGHGGQILLGQAAADLVVGRLPNGVTLDSLGEHRLRDLGTSEHIHQLIHRGSSGAFPSLRTLSEHHNNLPAELTSFIGRREELGEVSSHLAAARMVTLTGVGGSGKTRLSLQVAADEALRFPDGVWFVELAPLADGRQLPEHLADVLGLSGRGGSQGGGQQTDSLRQVVGFLSARESLLVLDNCEHLISAAAEVATAILGACPRVRILATSREGLGVRGEHLIQVPSMGLPSMFGLDVTDGYPDAMALFAARASAVGTFELGPANHDAVAEICRRLDGMPLAIELAAARTRMMQPAQIATRLNDAFRLLTGGARTALERQQTLLATVDWSYQLLSEAERLVFDRLAVFRGGFTLEAAEAVVSGEGINELDIFDHVSSLVDKSMVEARVGSGRFRLLETLRQFAVGRLTEEGGGDQWRRRHAEYYRGIADDAFWKTRSGEQVEWFERLDADHENLKAAITWAEESGGWELAGRIAVGLWWYWQMQGHLAIGLPILRRLKESGSLSDATRAKLLTAICCSEFEAGDIQVTLAAGDEAVALARRIDDPELLYFALLYWANTAGHNFGRVEDAHTAYDEAYAVAASIGHEWGMGWVALNKGWIHRLSGDWDEGRRWLSDARGRFASVGIPAGEAWAVYGLGLVKVGSGDLLGGDVLLGEGLAAHTSLGNKGAMVFGGIVRSVVKLRLGEVEEASELVHEALLLNEQIQRNALGHWRAMEAHLRRAEPREAFLHLVPLFDETELFNHAAVLTAELCLEAGVPLPAARLVAFGLDHFDRAGLGASTYFGTEGWAELVDRIRREVDAYDEVAAEWGPKEIGEVTEYAKSLLPELRTALGLDGVTGPCRGTLGSR